MADAGLGGQGFENCWGRAGRGRSYPRGRFRRWLGGVKGREGGREGGKGSIWDQDDASRVLVVKGSMGQGGRGAGGNLGDGRKQFRGGAGERGGENG